jgi:hypothetical protein
LAELWSALILALIFFTTLPQAEAFKRPAYCQTPWHEQNFLNPVLHPRWVSAKTNKI